MIRPDPQEHEALRRYAEQNGYSMSLAGRLWIRSLPQYREVIKEQSDD